MSWNSNVRDDFPLIRESRGDGHLVYLDSAATTQKPQAVIDAIVGYYTRQNANVGRGVYSLSTSATELYEGARVAMQRFIHARGAWEIVFTKGTTEAVNLVARCYAEEVLSEGDEVVVSSMEHHGNLCPWQAACKKRGGRIRVIPLDGRGELDIDGFEAVLNERTKIVAVSHVSNVLGTVNPVRTIVAKAHERGIPVLVDGAQAVGHVPVDVQDIDCDFYCFSSHKMYGPMGIGVLYAKERWLNQMPPYQSGGGMPFSVGFEGIRLLQAAPHKFEAGTPNVEGAVGLAAAARYLSGLGLEQVRAHDAGLRRYALSKLAEVPGAVVYGKAKDAGGLVSFVLDEVHPYDVGKHLDELGIAVRAGVHCTMPLIELLGLPVGTVRASFGVYTTESDIDALCQGLRTVKKGYWSLEKPNQRI